ncbi:MAG TPA: long-chain fatty acid--CoA ligase [Myxococcota bacterium]|nr:long-chain fatty acid--CoA ligase [Myxococcota bacterium]
MTRAELEREVLAWIAEGVDAKPSEERFEALALALFQLQLEHGEAYRRLCAAFGCDPRRVRHWHDVPAVPTGAFKEARLAIFPPAATVRVFRTSGSSTAARGALELDDLALYDASLEATFRAFVCPDVARIRFAVLAPSADDAPDSSLSYMFSRAVLRMGTPASRFLAGARGWDPDAAIAELAGAREPLAVVGTAFAFVHLLDRLAERGLALALPGGTRVMETGGFKGRSRELSREELHGAIAARLGVPRVRIVNQYGMCELASQFYEPTLRTGVPTDVKFVPPWVRTRALDPATGRDVGPGEAGVLVHYDLANVGSVLAVQTSDLGELAGDGFRVLGRLRGAEARGCSLAADALLGTR